MSPIVFNVTMELLPVDLKLGGLSVVFMVGNSGSATFPWMMGVSEAGDSA
jgi:fucose permease